MQKNRLEAFSDGVLAIVITIMVLELHAPEGVDLGDLRPLIGPILGYVLSFVYIGIYWNNHHHLLHTVSHVTGGILWTNLHLLFWLSLFPFATAWVSHNHVSAAPAAAYGGVLLMAAIAYYILQRAIIAEHGPGSLLASALGRDWKGKLSPVLYLLAIPLAFVSPWISHAIYIAVAMMWVIPDRRIETRLRGVRE